MRGTETTVSVPLFPVTNHPLTLSWAPLTPQVWPGEAVYPDYLAAPKVDTWIKAQLQRFYDEVPFDGLWLDMNEAANFCSGRLCKTDPKNSTLMHCKSTAPQRGPLGGGAGAVSLRQGEQVIAILCGKAVSVSRGVRHRKQPKCI
jgi:alpha-glucosidase (family GH31 glycosyl hydrolase)